MKVTVKLFSSLMSYLPVNVEDNEVTIDQTYPISAHQVLSRLNVPQAEVNTIMLNGVFLPVEERDLSLSDGDVLTVWPSIQGG